MPDDLESLRGRLESTVAPPPFERVAERAENTVRRRRTRRTVAVTSLAVAAIVSATVLVTALPEGGGRDVAGPPTGGRAANDERPKAGKIAVVELEVVATYRFTDGMVRTAVPVSVLKAARGRPVTVGVASVDVPRSKSEPFVLEVTEVKQGDMYSSRSEPCRDADVSVRHAKARIDIPEECVPTAGKGIRWSAAFEARGMAGASTFELVAVSPSRRDDLADPTFGPPDAGG